MTLRTLLGWLLFLAVETSVQVVFKFAGGGLDDGHGPAALLWSAVGSPWVIAGFGLYFLGFLVLFIIMM
jgi:hypothetical protein